MQRKRSPMSDRIARSEVDGRHLALPQSRVIRELLGLLQTLPASERKRVWICCALSVLVAISESAATALLVPFLGSLTGSLPNGLPGFAEYLPGRSAGERGFAIMAVCIAAFILFAAGARLLLLRTRLLLEENAAHEIGSRIYARALGQPYADFVARNSSEIIAGLEKVRGLVAGVIGPALQALLAVLMGLIISLALLLIAPVIAIVLVAALVPFTILVTRLSQKPLERASKDLSDTYTARLKLVQEGLGGIRDIKIGRIETEMVERFRKTDARYRDAKVGSSLIAQAPGLIVEGLALAALVLAGALLVDRSQDMLGLLPLIGAVAYALRRLLPLWQQAYVLRSSLATYSGLLADIRLLLDLPRDPTPPASNAPGAASHRIELDKVGFAYRAGDRPVLSDIDLTIEPGDCVGLMGASGAGKSTLVDILSGLLLPSSGRVLIDGEPLCDANRAQWQSRIAYMPQAIFLLDASIAENIAFGTRGTLDERRVKEAAEAAEIEKFIEGLPEGYETRIGERGVRLSGGQRQRIGLARALYRKASLLILDESTSALDHATEARILASIGRLDPELSILMIAHRQSTLGRCDRIYRIDGGTLSLQGAESASGT